MKNALNLWPMAALLVLTLTLSACGEPAPEATHGHGHGHGPEAAHGAAESADKGPRNGRLLRDGDFVVELAIFESGVPPEYRAWVSKAGRALPPDAVDLRVELARLDGQTDQFRFAPHEDFLRGDGVVTEPHSFDVTVLAEYQGEEYRWTYESHEGRVTIAADSAEAAGIVMDIAGPRTIHDVLPLYGRIVTNPDAVRDVGARYAGMVKSVPKTVGDSVKAGETLARVESNDSLQVYSVTAPISGTITARMTHPGEQAGDAALFTISDLSQVWAELSVFPRDLARIDLGQSVRISQVDGAGSVTGKIARIAPSGSSADQALKVWAAFDSAAGGWTPGLYVNAEVRVGGADVPLAVRTTGLQAFRDFTAVFTRVEDTYEVRMLELGRSDGEYVEVLGGLKPGAPYVAENSYLIKADIEKSGASHDH
ncbi:MAG: efflux RND transporter periplasmic adaptor subunit [Pseudomonadota bacterium]|nr:efflux RND transporter periplasmic adaptor subunit [Pseudomonadota bacterium]